MLPCQSQRHDDQPAPAARAALAAMASTHDVSRQQSFTQAAKAYRVPASVLLAVSYLESGWNTNAWHDAIAAYGAASGGAPVTAASRRAGDQWFADQVCKVMRGGTSRRTDGQGMRLAAQPTLRTPAQANQPSPDVDCPATLDCTWVPAPYTQLDPNDSAKYGNHDISDRQRTTEIKYIVHPRHRGHLRPVAAARPGRHLVHRGDVPQLVRHLAAEYGVPLDRAHILGHDMVPGRRRRAPSPASTSAPARTGTGPTTSPSWASR